jgi:hypothetical protein
MEYSFFVEWITDWSDHLVAVKKPKSSNCQIKTASFSENNRDFANDWDQYVLTFQITH